MFEAEKYLIVLLASYLISYQLTSWLIALLTSLGFIDQISARRIHKTPTPRGGGLAIALSVSAVCLFSFYSPLWLPVQGSLTENWWIATLLPGSILLLIGLIDDRVGISWSTKLIGQATAAVLLYANGIKLGSISGIELHESVSLVLTIIWVLGFVNAFNLIDGLDGLASGLAMIAAAGLALSSAFRGQPLDALFLLTLLGATGGFLRHNFHPARIFLGDTGSMFLGFTLAAVSLQTSTKATLITSMGMPLLAVGIPILDTLLAIWRRSVRAANKSPDGNMVKADLDHLHHRLLARGLTQKRAALLLYGLNAGLVLIGLATVAFADQAISILIIAFLLGAYVIFKHLAQIELWDSSQLALRGLTRPSRSVLATLAYPILDIFFLTVCWAIATYLGAIDDNKTVDWKFSFKDNATLWLGLVFCALALSRTYSRVWSRASISELFNCALSIGTGSVIALALIRLASLDGDFANDINFFLLFTSLGILSLCSIRAFPRMIQDWARRSTYTRSTKLSKALVYGAGPAGILLLRSLGTNKFSLDVNPIGFIDDDVNLRKRLVYGLEILGNGKELSKICKEKNISVLLLAANITPEMQKHVVATCKSAGVTIYKWNTEIVKLETQEVPVAPENDRAAN